MASPKGKFARFFGDLLLSRASVVAADEVGGFRRLVLRGEGLKPAPGTKLQLLLPSDDMRTYTPIVSPEGVVLLGWKGAGGPGAAWMGEVAVGAEVRFVGPQRSLELPPGEAIVVGDETSVAVAASFEAERPGKVRAVFEGGSVDDVKAAAEAVGLRSVTVVARGDTTALVEAIVAARAASPGASVALTGSAARIVAVRSALRAKGIGEVKAKTYWAEGRRGLD